MRGVRWGHIDIYHGSPDTGIAYAEGSCEGDGGSDKGTAYTEGDHENVHGGSQGIVDYQGSPDKGTGYMDGNLNSEHGSSSGGTAYSEGQREDQGSPKKGTAYSEGQFEDQRHDKSIGSNLVDGAISLGVDVHQLVTAVTKEDDKVGLLRKLDSKWGRQNLVQQATAVRSVLQLQGVGHGASLMRAVQSVLADF